MAENEFVPCCHIENCGEHMDIMAKNGFGYCIKHYSKIKESEIAELNRSNMFLGKEIYNMKRDNAELEDKIKKYENGIKSYQEICDTKDKEIEALKKENADIQIRWLNKYADMKLQLANAENETLDNAIKLCDDEIAYEEYVKDRQTEPFKAMVQFGIARLEELKSAILAMKKEAKT